MNIHVDKSRTSSRFLIRIHSSDQHEFPSNKISILCNDKEMARDLILKLEEEIERIFK